VPFEGGSMTRSPRPIRTAANLPDSIHQQLTTYALAAGAAGVGLLALAQPVQAKIVYTPAHVKFTQFPPVPLDLDHDGKADFMLALGGDASSAGAWQYAWEYAPRSHSANQDVATAKGGYRAAVALRAGSRIGPGRLFGDGDILVKHFSHFGRGSSYTNWYGQWGNAGKGLKNRYLGLKFAIDGKIHFGWARVTVSTNGGTFTATLTGYAYETIPNKSIIAGKTNGPDDEGGKLVNPTSLTVPIPARQSLGMLALGAQGVPLWRRKESVGATQ
jgi:hypothetical protein